MSDFDSVLDSLGGFGSYQRQVFLLVSAFETPAAWVMLLPVFIGAAPKWWLSPQPGKNGHLLILSQPNNWINSLKRCILVTDVILCICITLLGLSSWCTFTSRLRALLGIITQTSWNACMIGIVEFLCKLLLPQKIHEGSCMFSKPEVLTQ